MAKIIFFMFLMSVWGLLEAQQQSFQLSSPAFKHQGKIPQRFSCQGENISPPLMWTKGSSKIKSYALIMIDYDAAKTKGHPVVHWVVYDIVPNVHYLTTGTSNIIVGLNSYEKKGYIGMCPPEGPSHDYYFDLYALDVAHLDVPSFPTSKEVTEAMQGHVIDKTSMVAAYRRQ
ncbi:MAG: YbhB/YbcL family Raf kinase inhibitor-like protein [Gammaproteobacteria bacterium]|nr:YbhB/YbcL family Raf kinase inhibitor-like protein [Gammaproteobacteria bacterium]